MGSFLKMCIRDRKEYDVPHDEPVHGCYQFAYVGLVLVDDLCIIVYPVSYTHLTSV